jgi:hypothetical protein
MEIKKSDKAASKFCKSKAVGMVGLLTVYWTVMFWTNQKVLSTVGRGVDNVRGRDVGGNVGLGVDSVKGWNVGGRVGRAVLIVRGLLVGGSVDGDLVGAPVGPLVGASVGPLVGASVGPLVGASVGPLVGDGVACFVGEIEGKLVDTTEGLVDGRTEGTIEGASVIADVSETGSFSRLGIVGGDVSNSTGILVGSMVVSLQLGLKDGLAVSWA